MNVTDIESAPADLGMTVVEQLSGGTFGASLVTTGRGAKAVLKVLPKDEHWSEDRVRSAVQAADALRRDGYPIPRYLDAGEVQTLLRFAGDERVLDLLDEALAVGERIDPTSFGIDDVVHNDFTGSNVLVQGDNVVAVIDWEGARVGDSRADLATLAFYHLPKSTDPAVIRLLDAAIGEMPAEIGAALAAKFALGKLYFALRAGDASALTLVLAIADYWLRPLWRSVLQ